jgi:hypothetical protein
MNYRLSDQRDLRRTITLLVVAALHAVLITALLVWHPGQRFGDSAPKAVELIYLPPPPRSPAVRWENPRPHPLSASLPRSIAPPTRDQGPGATPSSRSSGNGSAVDWRAEARRALQAFEIRTNRHANGEPTLGMSAEEELARGPHHAGDRFKTESGDWIVWINSTCYQVASSSSPTYATGGALPQTICPDASKYP